MPLTPTVAPPVGATAASAAVPPEPVHIVQATPVSPIRPRLAP
jgi:hypothetical protein